MKSKDLMVGDFILVERNEGIYGGPVWKQPGKVLEIYQDEIKVLFADENGDNEYDEILTFLPHEVDGLPITPERLEKNGFEEFDGWRILDMDDVEIRWIGTILEISGSLGNMELPNVQCVHELQHALKLCGIDKTIEL